MLLLANSALAQTGSTQTSSAPTSRSWRELFNGKDLAGWVPKFTGCELGVNYANTFRVVDGLLTVSYDEYDQFGDRFGHLFYDGTFSDYRLRVEYRFVGQQVSGGAGWAFRNSGLMLYGQRPDTMRKDQNFPVSIEMQLLGGRNDGERPTANLCTPGTHVVRDDELFTPHCVNSSSPTFRGDRWVTVEVEVRGGSVRHRVGGDTVLAYRDPQLDARDKDAQRLIEGGADKLLRAGTISVQAESHPVQFRRIEILELPEPGPWTMPFAVNALGVHCETSGNWSLGGGGARLVPRDEDRGWQRFGDYLWLAEADFGEFEAEFEYRLERGGNSGFFFHVGDVDDPVATGFEVQIKEPTSGAEASNHDVGGLIPGGPPAQVAAKGGGAWNHMHVLCEGGSVEVTLNDKLVQSVQLRTIARDRPALGPVGFQDHGTPVELRAFRIRRLAAR